MHFCATLHLLMKVRYAVDLIDSIDGEWNPIQASAADDAGEALRMVRLACGAEDSVQDRFCAN